MCFCVQFASQHTSSAMCFFIFFFFKQKTAYEMRISDWSSDVCSSDLVQADEQCAAVEEPGRPKTDQGGKHPEGYARPATDHNATCLGCVFPLPRNMPSDLAPRLRIDSCSGWRICLPCRNQEAGARIGRPPILSVGFTTPSSIRSE